MAHDWRRGASGGGIDPTQPFTVRKLLGNDQRAHLLPLGIEIPGTESLDTVFRWAFIIVAHRYISGMLFNQE